MECGGGKEIRSKCALVGLKTGLTEASHSLKCSDHNL